MELKTMFPNLNVMWSRWSEYTTVTDRGGAEYLVPAPGAAELAYNCADRPEELVADALELGRRLLVGGLEKVEKTRLCAAFAACHGLLGLEAEKDTACSDDPSLPPFCQPLNSSGYGEDLGLFQVSFMELYQHFAIVRGERALSEQHSRVMDLSGLLRYRLTSGRTPQLVWEARSMRAVLHLAYAAMVAAPSGGLKVCKNCGKVYYNPHAKSEFCSARCRNYFNVRAFREREKETPR